MIHFILKMCYLVTAEIINCEVAEFSILWKFCLANKIWCFFTEITITTVIIKYYLHCSKFLLHGISVA